MRDAAADAAGYGSGAAAAGRGSAGGASQGAAAPAVVARTAVDGAGRDASDGSLGVAAVAEVDAGRAAADGSPGVAADASQGAVVPAAAAVNGAAVPAETRALRHVFGRFATGVTVLTAGRDTPFGMTANSFTSVSLDPPLVLVCVVPNAAVHDVILAEGTFALSILSADQEKLARHFADRTRPRGPREFEPCPTHPGPETGAPILSESMAWLECRLAATYTAGDHSILLGAVLTFDTGPGDNALVFQGGGFHRLG